MDENHRPQATTILTPFLILLSIHKGLLSSLASSPLSKQLNDGSPIAYSGPSNVQHISRLSKWQRCVCWVGESFGLYTTASILNVFLLLHSLFVEPRFPSPEAPQVGMSVVSSICMMIVLSSYAAYILRWRIPPPKYNMSSYIWRVIQALAGAGIRFQDVSDSQARRRDARWRTKDGVLAERFTIFGLELPGEEGSEAPCSVLVSFYENGYVTLVCQSHATPRDDRLACVFGRH